MKKLILIVVLLSNQLFFSQEKYKGKIQYDMILNFESVQNFNAELVFNNEVSTYTYINLDQTRSETSDENNNINIKVPDSIPKIIHIDKRTQKLYNYASVFSYKEYYWIVEDNPKIEWSLSDETKKIGSFICSKATTTFRGRNYTAWYSLDIKGNFGPWKLQGLPGMILEAYDDKKEVLFLLKKVEIPFESKIEFDIKKIKPISVEETKKIEKEKFEEAKQKMESMQERGFKLKISVKHGNSIEK